MDDKPTLAKITSDLWIHQNLLMWNRLQTLAILQAGLLGATVTLAGGKWAVLTFFTPVVAIAATFFLMHISSVDRAVRDKYRDDLKIMGITVGFDMTKDADRERYRLASWEIIGRNQRKGRLDLENYMNGIFISLMALDGIAGIVIFWPLI